MEREINRKMKKRYLLPTPKQPRIKELKKIKKLNLVIYTKKCSEPRKNKELPKL